MTGATRLIVAPFGTQFISWRNGSNHKYIPFRSNKNSVLNKWLSANFSDDANPIAIPRFQIQEAPRSPSGKIILNQALRKTIQSVHAEEGIRAFWRYTSLLDNLRYCIIINLSYHRGNLSATALWISYSAIQFGCYQNMDRFWSTEIKHAHPTSVHVVNGAISGVLAAVLTYPLDLFRTIFAAQGVPRRYPTIPSLARSLYHTKGASGFFQGIGPTLLQIAPYMGLSFGIYSTLDRLSNSKSIESRVLTASKLFSYLGNGAVSGLVSKLAVYPIDTIKKRMQMQSVQRTPMYGTIQKYTSSWHCVKTIFHYEGLYGFYKGVTPSIAKSVVTQSSTFACYELGIHMIKFVEAR